MNAHNMYLEPEDQQVFQHEAPDLLKSMWKSRLLMAKSINMNNFDYSLLPVSLENTSQNAYVSIGLSASRSSDEISEGTSSPSIRILGPAGDESPCVLETLTTRPASLISDVCFYILPSIFICLTRYFKFLKYMHKTGFLNFYFNWLYYYSGLRSGHPISIITQLFYSQDFVEHCLNRSLTCLIYYTLNRRLSLHFQE